MKNLEIYGVHEITDSTLKLVSGGTGGGRFIGRVVGTLFRYGGGYIGGVNFVTDYARYRAMR